jgi:Na+-transporting NADH:ubiquinone oxidoreductase subunit NqrF
MLPRRQSPNILMIVANGVGYGDVSFMMTESFEEGKTNTDKATPTLNQLAESGIVLEAMCGGGGTLASATSADEATPSQQVRTFMFGGNKIKLH